MRFNDDDLREVCAYLNDAGWCARVPTRWAARVAPPVAPDLDSQMTFNEALATLPVVDVQRPWWQGLVCSLREHMMSGVAISNSRRALEIYMLVLATLRPLGTVWLRLRRRRHRIPWGAEEILEFAPRAGNMVEYDYLPMQCLNDAQLPFLDHDTWFITEDLRARGDVMVTTHAPTLLER